jgi:hypothetical protein
MFVVRLKYGISQNDQQSYSDCTPAHLVDFCSTSYLMTVQSKGRKTGPQMKSFDKRQRLQLQMAMGPTACRFRWPNCHAQSVDLKRCTGIIPEFTCRTKKTIKIPEQVSNWACRQHQSIFFPLLRPTRWSTINNLLKDSSAIFECQISRLTEIFLEAEDEIRLKTEKYKRFKFCVVRPCGLAGRCRR